jgi:K+/H+ antiporter YhaU regulatory subunit KhtT
MALEESVTVVGTPTRLLRATLLVAGLFLGGTVGYQLIEGGLGIVAVQRGVKVVPSPPAEFKMEADDVLVVFGSRQQIDVLDRDC